MINSNEKDFIKNLFQQPNRPAPYEKLKDVGSMVGKTVKNVSPLPSHGLLRISFTDRTYIMVKV